MSPPIVTFYSYKGGTGRTTATANTAAMLAKRGNRVVCVDLDLDGPGLAIVFGDENVEPRLQEYLLTRDTDIESLLTEKTDLLRTRDKKARLWYVPSGIDFREALDYSDGRRMIRDMEALFSKIADFCQPDIILIDAPSGYGELSALSMYLSTCLVVLFRLSRQHVLGTVRVAEFVKRFGLRQITVASCVPTSDPEAIKPAYLQLLRDKLALVEDLPEIQDSDELKWQERVLLFGETTPPVLNDYSNIATLIEEQVF